MITDSANVLGYMFIRQGIHCDDAFDVRKYMRTHFFQFNGFHAMPMFPDRLKFDLCTASVVVLPYTDQNMQQVIQDAVFSATKQAVSSARAHGYLQELALLYIYEFTDNWTTTLTVRAFDYTKMGGAL